MNDPPQTPSPDGHFTGFGTPAQSETTMAEINGTTATTMVAATTTATTTTTTPTAAVADVTATAAATSGMPSLFSSFDVAPPMKKRRKEEYSSTIAKYIEHKTEMDKSHVHKIERAAKINLVLLQVAELKHRLTLAEVELPSLLTPDDV